MWFSRGSRGRKDPADTAPAPSEDAQAVRESRAAIETLERRLSTLESLVHPRLEVLEKANHELTLAVAEGIERVDRAERRVRAAVQRARQRMADLGYEDEGLEAEAQGLHELDAGGGGEEGVQPVQAGVANPFEGVDISVFPGDWS